MSDYRIHGATGEWEVVIGLEVHAQVTSKAKLFSGARPSSAPSRTRQVSLVDAAMPGMLPVPNEECIRQAVRTGMALEARSIPGRASTARIISTPTCRRATRSASSTTRSSARARSRSSLDEKDESSAKTVGIERIHLEQDAGKLMHDQHPSMSYVDLNRSASR
jgi:aspartyl-tRNA(Asn)/glutamyl-tRNA(Gln) amidotransferase subunit B